MIDLPTCFRELRDQRNFKAEREEMKRLLRIHCDVRSGAQLPGMHLAPEASLCSSKIKNSSQFKIQFSGHQD